MNTIIRQLTDRFPEPEFSLLRDAVFNDIEQRSLELAEVIAAEKAGATAEPSASSHYPMSRFGAYVGEQLIGWSSGHLERGNCFYMASSGVIAEHRNKGVYSGLLEAVLLHAQELGGHK